MESSSACCENLKRGVVIDRAGSINATWSAEATSGGGTCLSDDT